MALENLHKIAFEFNSNRNEAQLRARLESEATGAGNSILNDLLNPGDLIEVVSKLHLLPDNGKWEWYPKMIADTDVSVYWRGQDGPADPAAVEELATRLFDVLDSDPRTVDGSIVRTK